MEELKSSALSFIAHNLAAVANLSHDLAGLADSLLSRLAKVWRMVWYCSDQECCSEHVMGPLHLFRSKVLCRCSSITMLGHA